MKPTMTPAELNRARRLLCALQDSIRDALVAARVRQSATFAKVAAVTTADTIYQVDRLSEAAIMAWFEAHWPRAWPVELVMEGLESGVPATFPRGTPVARTRFKCILDPIDGCGASCMTSARRGVWPGSRCSAGRRDHLGDIVVAAMTELPTSKQWRADQLSAVRGGGVVADAVDVRGGGRKNLTVRPSPMRHFEHGFASLARFFPEGKGLLGAIEEDPGKNSACTGNAAGNSCLTTNTSARAGNCTS